MSGVKPGFSSCFKFAFCYSLKDSDTTNSIPTSTSGLDYEVKPDAFVVGQTQASPAGCIRTNKMTQPESVKTKCVTFDASDKDQPARAYRIHENKEDSVHFDGKYERTVSHPVDLDDTRLSHYHMAEIVDERYTHFQHVASASTRRSMRNGRRRSNSLYGVNPNCKFGPKGYIPDLSSGGLTIPDPNQKLYWLKPPLTVLIFRKHLDEMVLPPFRDLVIWLLEEKWMVVYVEKMVMEEPFLLKDEKFQLIKDRLKTFKEGVDDLTDKVDFIICLGGDGTLLYVSSLFQSSVPPVMAFNMGSLGFLTPFQFCEDFKSEVTRVMEGSASLLLRFRLKCVVITRDTASTFCIPHVKHIHKDYVSVKQHKLVLNEVVIDRGPSPYLSNLDLYIEGRHVTTVQGDGLIISTPTGSTAYAVSAGASMIHPSVPCILVTPICPHSLSFRPVVIPAGVEIRVVLSPGARGTAMASFDGRDRVEINPGDSLRITTSSFPVPSVCAADQIADWFDSLSCCLNWNQRLTQRPLQISSSTSSFESYDSDGIPTTVPLTSSKQQQQQKQHNLSEKETK